MGLQTEGLAATALGIAGIGRAYADFETTAFDTLARRLVDSHRRTTPRPSPPKPPGAFELGDALDSEGFFHQSPEVDAAMVAQLEGRQLITPRDIDAAEWLTAFAVAATAMTSLVLAAVLTPWWVSPIVPGADPVTIWLLTRRIKQELEHRRITP